MADRVDARADVAALPVPVIRYGKDEPLPERRQVRAGPLTAVLENADLRYVRLGDHEIALRIYVAVRNRNWDTIAARFTRYEVEDRGDSFSLRWSAEHVKGDVDFACDGSIEGTADGVITFTLDGVARKSFLRNRIGFCVLHSMEVAGLPAETETPDGIVRGAFPIPISPHQPFFDMQSISHPVGENARVTFRFEGDLFEMEDQRNWTDASFKTYSTPLRLPRPVQIDAGHRVQQRVIVEVKGSAGASAAGDTAPRIEVGQKSVGTLPPIGFAFASHDQPLKQAQLDLVRTLRPTHLHVGLNLADADWMGRLSQAVEQARALGAALELEVIAGDQGEGLAELFARLAAEAVPVVRVLVFPTSAQVTTDAVMREARRAADAAGVGIPVGGGVRTNFVEFNRATLPLDQMQVAAYTINAQVHAFDILSLVETLRAQATTVESARRIAGAMPVAIHAVTLRPRFNPDATGPIPDPAPGELPPAVDVRQMSLFAAAWTVGSIRHLAAAGAGSLTYYETTGWRGVIERSDGTHGSDPFPWLPGALFPLYHVFADVAEFTGGELLEVAASRPLEFEALALRSADRIRILVAHFGVESATVTLALPRLADVRLRLLDETTAAVAMADRQAFLGMARDLGDIAQPFELALNPFAVACLDGQVTQR